MASAAQDPSTDTPDSARRLTAEDRKAILDQRVAAAVASGGRVASWGGGTLETVVSYHRYLPAPGWAHAFPLLLLGLVFAGPVTPDFLRRDVVPVLFVGVTGLWAGRTRYERISVDEQGGVREAGATLLAAAAAVTLLVGLFGAIFGGAHLAGVIETAARRGYTYDFRLAALLLLGITIVFAGAVCLTAVRGLVRGQ